MTILFCIKYILPILLLSIMLEVKQEVLWRSLKIDGKWYKGVIIGIDTRGTKRKKNPEYHISTGRSGFYGVVIRTEIDIKINM